MSLPASGSVTANAACISPLTTRGRWRRFISSLPCITIGVRPKIDRWIALAAFIAPAYATSRMTSAASVIPSPAAAVFLGNRDAQVTGLGDGLVEVVREFVCGVLGAPVLVVEARAHRAHTLHDFLLRLG